MTLVSCTLSVLCATTETEKAMKQANTIFTPGMIRREAFSLVRERDVAGVVVVEEEGLTMGVRRMYLCYLHTSTHNTLPAIPSISNGLRHSHTQRRR